MREQFLVGVGRALGFAAVFCVLCAMKFAFDCIIFALTFYVEAPVGGF